jgi:hypothetical protein
MVAVNTCLKNIKPHVYNSSTTTEPQLECEIFAIKFVVPGMTKKSEIILANNKNRDHLDPHDSIPLSNQKASLSLGYAHRLPTITLL